MNMSSTLDRIETQSPAATPPAATGHARALPAIVVAVIAIGLAAFGAVDTDLSAVRAVTVAVAIAWGPAAAAVAWQRPDEPAGLLVAGLALAGGAALAADAQGSEVARAFAAVLTAAVGFHLAVGLPDGRLRTRVRQVLVGGAYVAAATVAGVAGDDTSALRPGVIALATALGVVAVAGFADRCRRASVVDRSRLQWFGWGVVVAVLVGIAAWVLDALVSWPQDPGAVAVAGTALVPLSLALGASDRLAVRVDRLLVNTIVAGGIIVLVGAAYLLVVVGLGTAPETDEERALLGLSMIAAAVAAVFVGPVRTRLDEIAHRRVYGERRSPEEALETFGSRMSRAVPMDELLLQLAESLKKSMQLSAAQVWTGGDGVVELAVSVPNRGTRRIVPTAEELAVVSRARVSGNAWVQVWLPALLDGRDGRVVRVAPVTHSGELLGLLVVERTADGAPFTEDEERVLTELARQVGLALHNVRLDSALQASLDELRTQAEELRASRARIVASGDQARRQIERNLHDGAQQHLVALAVKLGLARQLLDGDPAVLAPMLEELRGDAQETLTQLRELAHGIYPPLLMDRGLAEALRAAANRSTLPVDVVADGGRFPGEVEAAVYFCCLEAMQNAGKHAGEGARMTVTVTNEDDELRFEVADDGAGFDAAGDAGRGHGFVNMADRVGAIGGRIDIDSSPGGGTRVRGRLPLSD